MTSDDDRGTRKRRSHGTAPRMHGNDVPACPCGVDPARSPHGGCVKRAGGIEELAMTETIRFEVPLPPGPLRRNRETAHRGYRSKLIREYQEQVWCAAKGNHGPQRFGECPMCDGDMPWPRAHLRLTWRHHRVGPDVDNALASCKWLIDVLKATGPRPLGIVQDDSPEHLTVKLTTEKVRSKAEECVVVEIARTSAETGDAT